MAESMYQNLKVFMPASTEDDRSVHFLMIPEVNEACFDADIERAVSRMQKVIELGRYIREKKTLSLKTPLREFVIINPDPEYLADVKSLENYIYEELNIRTLTLTSEEEKYGVKYKLEPDHKILGQKLKEFGKVKSALGKLTESDARTFAKRGKLNVGGFDLVDGDLNVMLPLNF